MLDPEVPPIIAPQMDVDQIPGKDYDRTGGIAQSRAQAVSLGSSRPWEFERVDAPWSKVVYLNESRLGSASWWSVTMDLS